MAVIQHIEGDHTTEWQICSEEKEKSVCFFFVFFLINLLCRDPVCSLTRVCVCVRVLFEGFSRGTGQRSCGRRASCLTPRRRSNQEG